MDGFFKSLTKRLTWDDAQGRPDIAILKDGFFLTRALPSGALYARGK